MLAVLESGEAGIVGVPLVAACFGSGGNADVAFGGAGAADEVVPPAVFGGGKKVYGDAGAGVEGEFVFLAPGGLASGVEALADEAGMEHGAEGAVGEVDVGTFAEEVGVGGGCAGDVEDFDVGDFGGLAADASGDYDAGAP